MVIALAKISTKSKSEVEDEEVERLVRKSPKYKPPRLDKERRRVEEPDTDLDSEDKDLSMNYKDIGGSVVSYVVERYLYAADDDFLNEYTENPETGRPVLIRTLGTRPKGSPARAKYDELLKKHQEGEEDEADIKEIPNEEEESEKEKKPKEEEKPKTEKKEEPEEPEKQPEPTIEDTIDMESLQEKARLKNPLPANITRVQDFTGDLDIKDIEALQNHMKNWNLHEYNRNIIHVERNLMEAQLSGNDRDADYFKKIIQTYQGAKDQLRHVSLKQVEDVTTLLEGSDSQPASDQTRKDIASKKPEWHQMVMFSPLSQIAKKRDQLEEIVEGSDRENPTEKELYAIEMMGVMDSIRDRKMLDEQFSTDAFLLQVQEYEDLEVDPIDYDLTSAKEREELLSKINSLNDKQLAEVVKENSKYMMYFSFDPYDTDSLYISDKERSEFLDALESDLELRGFYEQLDFGDDIHLYSEADLKEFREQVEKTFKHKKKKVKDTEYRDLWGIFLDWVDDTMAKTRKESSIMKKVKAQYRGLPGPLHEDDYNKPPSTDWRLPVSAHSLDIDDFMAILKEAKVWLRHANIRDMEADIKYRIALDYAIYTADDHKYNGSIDAPNYDKLVALLMKTAG